MAASVHRRHVVRKVSHILLFSLPYSNPRTLSLPFPISPFISVEILNHRFSRSSTSLVYSRCKDTVFAEAYFDFMEQFSPFRHLSSPEGSHINSNERRKVGICLSRMIKLHKGFILERFSGNFCPYDLATILISLDDRLAALAFFKLVLRDVSGNVIRSCCVTARLLAAEDCRLIAQDVFFWVITKIGQYRTNEVVEFVWHEHRKYGLDVFVFDSLMRGFLNAEMGSQAVEVLYKMREVGLKPSLSAVCILFKLFLRVGDYGSVWKLLRDMLRQRPCPNNFVFNVLILGFCKRGCIGIAQSLLHVIRKYGCEPDVYAYNILINEYSVRGWTSHALSMMLFMVESGCKPSTVTFGTVINALCKEGNVVKAREVFDGMLEVGTSPSTVVFNSLLNGYVKARQIDQANILYENMKTMGVNPDGITLNILVAGHYKYGREEDGDRLWREFSFDDMKNDETLPDISIGRLCWAERVDEALDLLEGMLEKGIPVSIIAFNSLISAYGRSGFHEKAFLVYNKMFKFGLNPSVSTFTSLILGLSKTGKLQEARDLMIKIIEKGFCLSTKPFSALVDGYFHKGDIMEARKLWDEMVTMRMAPDTVAFSVLIDGLCKNGFIADGYAMLQEMIGAGLIPNNYAYNSLIAACCNNGQLDRALEMEMEMRQRGLLPDVFTTNIIINAYCKQGKMKSATQVYIDMYRNGLQPDIVTYNTLISGYCKGFDNMTMVDNLVNKMYANGWDPDLTTYNVMIHGCYVNKRANRALTMFNGLLSLGIVPDTVTYNTLLSGICHDILDRAIILTGKLLKMGFVPNIVTANLLLSNLQKQGLPQRALMWGQKLSQIQYDFDKTTYEILDRASCAMQEDGGYTKGITSKSLFIDFLMYITYDYIYRHKVNAERKDNSLVLIKCTSGGGKSVAVCE